MTGHRNRRSAGEFNDVGVADPRRHGDDHFITGVNGRHHGVEDNLSGAAGGQDLADVVAQFIIAQELALNGGAQRGRAVRRRVAGIPGARRGIGGIDHVRRRGKSGSPVETDDVDSLRGEIARFCVMATEAETVTF